MKFRVDMEGIDPLERHGVLKHFGVDRVDALSSLMEMVADWVERYMGQQSRYDLVSVSIVPVIFEQREWDDNEKTVRVQVVAGRVRQGSSKEAQMWLALYPGIKETFVHETVHLLKPGSPEASTRQMVLDLKKVARWEKPMLKEALSGN